MQKPDRKKEKFCQILTFASLMKPQTFNVEITAPVGSWESLKAAIQAGAAGIFLATQHASYRLLSEDEYGRFGEPFDRMVLEALGRRAWFSVLHLHGPDVMFERLANYPVQAINWHDRETAPTLGAGKQGTRSAVIGGLRQWDTMVRGAPADVRAEIDDAMQQTGGQRLIIGTGCVTPIVAPLSNIRAAREAVDKYARMRG